jgi:iron complex transport system substrate-binding protein
MWKPQFFLAATMLAAIVSQACGGSDGGGSASSSSTPEPCREITHELGKACVPARPQRIVALDSLTVLPTLLDLDMPVIGSTAQYAIGNRFPTYMDTAKTAKLEIVGSGAANGEIDIEKIAALKPDLIIGWINQVRPIQAKLEAVAPTVATPFTFYNPEWRKDVRFIAEVVGKKDQFETQLKALDEKMAKTKAMIVATGKPFVLGRADVYMDRGVYYRYECTWFGDVLLGSGVTQPEQQKGPCTPGDARSAAIVIGPESFALLDAEIIVSYAQTSATGSASVDPIAKLAENPLWKNLRAVQNNRVHALGDAWGLGAGLRAANVILDDLQTKLIK